MTSPVRHCTAFIGSRRLASGDPATVALAVKREIESDTGTMVLVFDDDTGRPIDFDLRGSDEAVVARLAETSAEDAAPRGRGRPKLGVVPREITLLPRHWEWLGAQPGGTSVALRKLVETALKSHRGADRVRIAQEATGRVMTAVAGDLPGYEEATRALYARDGARFEGLVVDWPTDVREHIARLAGDVFGDAA